jgi:LacI family transcriptional regulator
LIKTGGWWQDDGYENAWALFQRKQIPTAIFCVSDRIAMGAYDAAKEKGLRIPDDISIVGFDNQELLAAHSRPPLTTVRIPYFEMGAWAVEQLIEGAATNQPARVEPAKLPCPLVLRASVGKPRLRRSYRSSGVAE